MVSLEEEEEEEEGCCVKREQESERYKLSNSSSRRVVGISLFTESYPLCYMVHDLFGIQFRYDRF